MKNVCPGPNQPILRQTRKRETRSTTLPPGPASPAPTYRPAPGRRALYVLLHEEQQPVQRHRPPGPPLHEDPAVHRPERVVGLLPIVYAHRPVVAPMRTPQVHLKKREDGRKRENTREHPKAQSPRFTGCPKKIPETQRIGRMNRQNLGNPTNRQNESAKSQKPNESAE